MFYEKLESEELRLQSFKIISNDMKLEPISWDLKFKNPFLKFCVGVWVGEHPVPISYSGFTLCLIFTIRVAYMYYF